MLRKFAQFALLFIGFSVAAISSGSPQSTVSGILQNNIYTNSSLGFSIKFPENWNVVSPSSNTQNLQEIDTNNTNSTTMLGYIKDNAFPLFRVTSNADNNAAIMGEAFKLSDFDKSQLNTNQQVMEQIKFALLKFSKIKPDYISPVYATKLGGLEFATMKLKLHLNDHLVNETAYTIRRNDYILFLVTASNSVSAEEMIQKTFNTMLFY